MIGYYWLCFLRPSSYWLFVLSQIFVRLKRIFAMTVRLLSRNFADNRAINAPKFTGVPSRNSRILTSFGEVCYHHFCTVLLKTKLSLLLKEKRKCSQVVWSTASFVSLTIHSTGWEDNSKLMNGPIATGSGVPVCCLMRVFFFFLRTVVLRTASIFHVWRPNC